MSEDISTDSLLEAHFGLKQEHHDLNKQVDGLKSSHCGFVADLKRERCSKKTQMHVLETKLGELPQPELSAHLKDLRRRLSLCSTGCRFASSQMTRERLEADIELLESILPPLHLAHDQDPQVAIPSATDDNSAPIAATG